MGNSAMVWKHLLFVAALLWSGAAAADPRALLIGIDHYPAPIPELGGAAKDVGRMRQVAIDELGFRSEDIQTLTNAQATRQNILASLQHWLVDGSRPGDLVLLQFSGHGHQIPAQYDDEEGGMAETIVPVDTTILKEPKTLLDEHGRVAGSTQVDNMITGHEIGEFLKKITDRRVIAVFDSCHSGGVTRGLETVAYPPGVKPRHLPSAIGGTDLLPGLPPVTSRGGVDAIRRQNHALIRHRSDNAIVFSAVTSAQEALDSGDGGVFTSLFYAGLIDHRADPASGSSPSIALLQDYLQRESEAFCKRTSCQLGLTPTLEAPTRLQNVSLRAFARGEPAPAPAPSAAPAPPTAVLAHDNQAAVSVEILPRSRVRLGEAVTFRVISAKAGKLIVLDVNAAGQMTQIFPNDTSRRHNRAGAIAAGRPLTIPDAYYGFEFRAREPLGKGLLVAIVTEDPAPVEQLLAQNLSLDPVPDATAFLNSLAEKLRQPWRQDETDRRLRWSMARTEYDITRGP